MTTFAKWGYFFKNMRYSHKRIKSSLALASMTTKGAVRREEETMAKVSTEGIMWLMLVSLFVISRIMVPVLRSCLSFIFMLD